MPIVRPDFGDKPTFTRPNWSSGRYGARLIEIKESDKTDRNGYNNLVFKFEVIAAADKALLGKRLSRWFPLGGQGAKSLWRCLKTLNPGYGGAEFDTAEFIGRTIEIDVTVEPDKTGNLWPRVGRVYPYIAPNDVATTLHGNVLDVVGTIDDFDA